MHSETIAWVDLLEIGVVGFAISCLLTMPLCALMRRVGWVDRPTERKRHVGSVPLAGGLSILLSIALTALLVDGWRIPTGLAVACLMVFGVGVLDDHFPLRAGYRFLVHVAAVLVAILVDGVFLLQLGQLIGPFLFELGWLGLPFTVFAAAGIISAMNMSDGADGLAAGLGLVALFWFFVVGIGLDYSVVPLAGSLLPLIVATAGALGGFLVFNARSPWRSRAAVFLGDGGSTALGMLLAWLAVHTTNGAGMQALSPVAALWIVALPLCDALSVIFRRLGEGGRATAADRRHLHHLLEQAGIGTAASVYTLLGVAFLLGAIGVSASRVGIPDWAMFGLLTALFLAYHVGAVRFWRRLDSAALAATPASVQAAAVGRSVGGFISPAVAPGVSGSIDRDGN